MRSDRAHHAASIGELAVPDQLSGDPLSYPGLAPLHRLPFDAGGSQPVQFQRYGKEGPARCRDEAARHTFLVMVVEQHRGLDGN
ncbi:MAG: hypothetical protein E5X10_24315, partial [Mesorhizobium sp.]